MCKTSDPIPYLPKHSTMAGRAGDNGTMGGAHDGTFLQSQNSRRTISELKGNVLHYRKVSAYGLMLAVLALL